MSVHYTLIEFPVFQRYVVHVEVAKDFKKAWAKYPILKKMMERGDLGDHNGGCDGDGAITISPNDHNISFVFFHPKPSLNTIVHESWHALQRMLEYNSVKYDHENTAYHLGYLVEQVHNAVYPIPRTKKLPSPSSAP